MRSQSSSPSRMRGRSNSPSRMRGRSGSPTRMRGRSGSPSRMRGRSGSPSRMRGRSSSPSRMRGRSGSPSRMRGRSGSPSRMRGRSGSPSRMRGRSGSPSRMRGRSGSPSQQRGRSFSSTGMRGRSASPSRMRGRSSSPSRMRSANVSSGDLNGDSTESRRGRFRRGGRGLQKNGRFGKSLRRISPKEGCTRWKFLSYALPILLLLGSTAGLIIVTGNAAKFTPNFIEGLIPTFNNEELQDPFAGTNTPQWNNGGSGGLELEFLNALDDSWQVYFALALADWDYGNPDALTLTSSKVAQETTCTAVTGKVKVCAGDYGETKWRGICDSLFDSDGYITASSTRMNEYYLEFDGEDAKQYTMCHEIGHSLGLGHTDEEFGNEDLGNCLDYTDNFNVNKHPDESNYESLLALYGPAARRHLRKLENVAPARRQLESRMVSRMHEEVEKFLERREVAHEHGWNLLHRTRHGEEHELALEEGYKVRVHVLLAAY